MDTNQANNHQYPCCFCRHFQLAGCRWGYCNLLNVYVRGDRDACQVSVPPFVRQEDSSQAEPQRNHEDNCDRSLKITYGTAA